MIILIQILVIFVALAVIGSVLIGKQSHSARAWKKIALSLLAIAMVIAVLFPDTTNKIANIVGVGRGADLLLYILTLAFIGYALNNYLHQQHQRDELNRLARKIAIIEAINRSKQKK